MGEHQRRPNLHVMNPRIYVAEAIDRRQLVIVISAAAE